MKGDKIHIKPAYKEVAHKIGALMDGLFESNSKCVIGISGESGSGKSVTALVLQQYYQEGGYKVQVIHMDDYFHLPPATNHNNRLLDIQNVGLAEVKLNLIEQQIGEFKNGMHIITKPLVDYDQNTIETEDLEVKDTDILIIEGTYIASVPGLDVLIFMERDYTDTRKNRIDRGREEFSEFIEKVLEIEHNIIAPTISKAQIIVHKNYQPSLVKPLTPQNE